MNDKNKNWQREKKNKCNGVSQGSDSRKEEL
jgi:hypothetical protein